MAKIKKLQAPVKDQFVDSTEARKILKMGATKFSALKASAGIRGRQFLISSILEWVARNPKWVMTQRYGKKRAAADVRIPSPMERAA